MFTRIADIANKQPWKRTTIYLITMLLMAALLGGMGATTTDWRPGQGRILTLVAALLLVAVTWRVEGYLTANRRLAAIDSETTVPSDHAARRNK